MVFIRRRGEWSELAWGIFLLTDISNGFVVTSFLPSQKPSHHHSRNCLPPPTLAFSSTLTGNTIYHQSQAPSSSVSSLQMLPDIFESTSLLQAVEVFDGSTIDPVVVSNVYWSSLTGKIIAVIIGQVLATITFSILAFFLSSQLKNLGDFVSKTVFNDLSDKMGTKNSSSSEFGSARTNNEVSNQAQSSTSSSKVIEPDISKLLLCIAIDVIGTSSELVPILGELTDVAWAPIAALTLKNIFGSNVIFALEFAEEILPFTDILPLATICWVIQTYYSDSDVAKALGLEQPIVQQDEDVIDVRTSRIVDSNMKQDRRFQLPDSDRDMK